MTSERTKNKANLEEGQMSEITCPVCRQKGKKCLVISFLKDNLPRLLSMHYLFSFLLGIQWCLNEFVANLLQYHDDAPNVDAIHSIKKKVSKMSTLQKVFGVLVRLTPFDVQC